MIVLWFKILEFYKLHQILYENYINGENFINFLWLLMYVQLFNFEIQMWLIFIDC